MFEFVKTKLKNIMKNLNFSNNILKILKKIEQLDFLMNLQYVSSNVMKSFSKKKIKSIIYFSSKKEK